MKMNKGFNPTPKKEPKITNVAQKLQRETKKFKKLINNPLVVASRLEQAANLELDTNDLEE